MTDNISRQEEEADLYPIRTVASITGVNPVTLRAWERRYGLIEPSRTDGRHRLYSSRDIELIQRALSLIDQGIPISKVKDALENTSEPTTAMQGPWQGTRLAMLKAVSSLNQVKLEQIYNEVVGTHPIGKVMEHLVLPVLEALGARWEKGEPSIAEEHFFALFLRNKLGARFHHNPSRTDGARLICCCVPGERHEIGLLMFALEAQTQGFRPILLGADMPIKELPAAVRRTEANAIILSCSLKETFYEQRNDIKELAAQSPVPIFLGGPIASDEETAVADTGAIPLGKDIERALRTIGERLDTTRTTN